MLRHFKLSDHGHTGKHRPHEHTAYVPLLFLLALVGFTLTIFTTTALTRPGPAAGSIGLSGTVPGKPPTTAAVITEPANGQRFAETPVTVRGTCPTNVLVQVFKNDIFAGSAVCSPNGTFELETDLLIGRNDLIARVYNDLNEAGPDSNTVTVYYDVVPAQADGLSPLSFGGEQLLLNTDGVFRGAFPGTEMHVPLDIIGGRPPFAVNIQWGDGTNRMVSRANNESFRVPHTYERPGTYSISIQATDADDRVAFLTVAAIVNGQPLATAATEAEGRNQLLTRLLVLWPLYAIILTMVVSFWLGEQREKRLLIRQGAVLPS